MTARVYDPSAHVLTWGEIEFEMLADGDSIEAGFDEEGTTTSTGRDGDVAVTLNQSRTASCTVRIMNVSPTNAVLSLLAPQNRPRGAPLIMKPLQMVDLNGTTVVFGEQAWIEVAAPVVRGKEHGNSEWKFRIAEADVIAGGSLVTE